MGETSIVAIVTGVTAAVVALAKLRSDARRGRRKALAASAAPSPPPDADAQEIMRLTQRIADLEAEVTVLRADVQELRQRARASRP